MNRISKNSGAPLKSQLDWIPIALPFARYPAFVRLLFRRTGSSRQTLDSVRAFLGDQFGGLVSGCGTGLFLAVYLSGLLAYGSIRLGKPGEKLSILPLFGVP